MVNAGDKRRFTMNLPGGLGEKAIKDVVLAHPGVGGVLERHGVACVTCQVGICLFKDVLSIHGLSAEESAEVEREIIEILNAEGGLS